MSSSLKFKTLTPRIESLEDPYYFTNIVSAAVLLAPSKDLIDSDNFWNLSIEVEKIYKDQIFRSLDEGVYEFMERKREMKKFRQSRFGHLEIIQLP